MDKKYTIHIIALASLGQGLSGGDRIYIELARRWSEKNNVVVYIWEEGREMCEREKLKGKWLSFYLCRVGDLARLGFVFTYFYRIVLGIQLGLTLKISEKDIVFSASEFWMDSLTAWLLKMRYPHMIWTAAWYQTAPNPLRGFSEGNNKRENTYRFRAFLYWLAQFPIKPLITAYASYVLVNNENERKQFPVLNKNHQVGIVFGAVDLKKIKHYQDSFPVDEKKKYTAVFQGRFHPQKGVMELMTIWKFVVEKEPQAVLAMIGDGPLMSEVKEKIAQLRLENNVVLFGYLHDGEKKYRVFYDSKIVVHSSFYDSGGMAAAEAMAFGLPAVGFDLVSYQSYYPQGMIKVSPGDFTGFAEKIITLLKNKILYTKMSEEAEKMIQKSWSWDTRAKEVFTNMITYGK